MTTNYTQLSDEQLIHLYQSQQCQRAIQTLILRHKDRIFTNIMFIMKDRYIAEDIFQESMLKVAMHIKNGKYAEQGKFAPWAARIAHNMCIDYIRKSKSSHAIKTIQHDDFPLENNISAANYNADYRINKKENDERLWKIINALPTEQMEVVVMRIYGQMSFKDISEAMGVSINTSLGRMRYGLINLRKMIEENQMVIR